MSKLNVSLGFGDQVANLNFKRVYLVHNHSLAHFLYVRALNIFFCYRIISKILQMCTREYLEDKFPEVELLGQEIKS